MKKKTDALRDIYRIRFTKLEIYRNNVWMILCDEYFSKFINPDSNILDLGSGWGEFINNINAANKWALDLNPDTKQHLNQGIIFLQQDCIKRWEIQSESLDVVFTSNLLEHLTERKNVEFTISEAKRCLKPNGIIICLGPNIKYLTRSYWDFWDHVIPITESSISELLKLMGFNIELSISKFLPYSMSQGWTPNLFLVRMYLKLFFLWPLFGKQFLVVGSKK